MEKKDKIQYFLNFIADALSLVCSVLLAWFITGPALDILLDYTREDWGPVHPHSGVCVSRRVSRLQRRFGADPPRLEVGASALHPEHGAAGRGAGTVALLLTKATMLNRAICMSACWGLHCIFLYLTHTALKTYLNKYFYKANFATMVGVITTSDRAAPLLRDLKKDWAKKLNGVVLLDAAAPGGKVEGIPVAAVYEGALDWLRREPLDEVYVSVPYQSGDSLRPAAQRDGEHGPVRAPQRPRCSNPTRLRRTMRTAPGSRACTRRSKRRAACRS